MFRGFRALRVGCLGFSSMFFGFGLVSSKGSGLRV